MVHKWRCQWHCERLQQGHRAPSNRHPINCCPRSVSDGNQLKLKLVKSLTYLRVCVQSGALVAAGKGEGEKGEVLAFPVVFGAFLGNKPASRGYGLLFLSSASHSNFRFLNK